MRGLSVRRVAIQSAAVLLALCCERAPEAPAVDGSGEWQGLSSGGAVSATGGASAGGASAGGAVAGGAGNSRGLPFEDSCSEIPALPSSDPAGELFVIESFCYSVEFCLRHTPGSDMGGLSLVLLPAAPSAPPAEGGQGGDSSTGEALPPFPFAVRVWPGDVHQLNGTEFLLRGGQTAEMIATLQIDETLDPYLQLLKSETSHRRQLEGHLAILSGHSILWERRLVVGYEVCSFE